jgi:hypothetical protein
MVQHACEWQTPRLSGQWSPLASHSLDTYIQVLIQIPRALSNPPVWQRHIERFAWQDIGGERLGP